MSRVRVKDPDRLDGADEFVFLAVRGWLLVLLAAGVVFIVWLWRARDNAELFCSGQHRRGRGWVIGGWFCPVVNFWFPKQIVDDVIAASDPANTAAVPRPASYPSPWPGAGLVAHLGRHRGQGQRGNLDLAADVRTSASALVASVATLGAVLTAVCAVLAVRVVRLVDRLQMSRPWTPWWATDPSTAPPAQYEMTDSETPVQRQLWSAQHLQQIQGASVTTPYGQGPQQPYGQPGQPPALRPGAAVAAVWAAAAALRPAALRRTPDGLPRRARRREAQQLPGLVDRLDLPVLATGDRRPSSTPPRSTRRGRWATPRWPRSTPTRPRCSR